MKRLIRYKFAYILFLFLMLVPTLTFTQPCNAWGAVINKSPVLNIFSWLQETLVPAREDDKPVNDINTHVRLMTAAYEFLTTDPALKDQKNFFPDINAISSWDKVYVTSVYSAAVHGGTWKADMGGPDAGGRTNDSDHYYNPLLNSANKGKGPSAVKEYYTYMLEELFKFKDVKKATAKGLNPRIEDHGPTAIIKNFTNRIAQLFSSQDVNKDYDSNEKLNKAAAWSAHFLADMHVPGHVVGVPAPPNDKLSELEAGPGYLDKPDKLQIDKEGRLLEDPPAEKMGREGDFSAVTTYFKNEIYTQDKSRHDWFDPWYYNGYDGNQNAKIATASHATWETLANVSLVNGNMLVKPDSYSTDWKNSAPSFGDAKHNIDNQAIQAEAFAMAAAKETRENLALYLKSPNLGANRAIQRIATLWRSSLTALRPSIQVKTDASHPKLLTVTATIESVELNDPATKVKARLTVEGGDINGAEIHATINSTPNAPSGKPVPVAPGAPVTVAPSNTVTVTPNRPWITEWQVESDNPDDCNFKLEVLCEYQKTPDLQYAVCEYSKPLSVTISPDQVEPKDKVTLTVKTRPPQRVELEINDGELLEAEGGRLNRNKDKEFKVSTDKNGEFKADYIVKKDAASGKHDIRVTAWESIEDAARFGDDIAWLNVGRSLGLQNKLCRVTIRCWMDSTSNIKGRTGTASRWTMLFGEVFEGSFTGYTFKGVLRPEYGWSGNGAERHYGYSGTGDITVVLEPVEISGPLQSTFKMSSFSVNYRVEKGGTDAETVECSVSGKPADELNYPRRIWDYFTVSKDTDVCRRLKAKIAYVSTSPKGQVTIIYDKPLCDDEDSIKIDFPEKHLLRK